MENKNVITEIIEEILDNKSSKIMHDYLCNDKKIKIYHKIGRFLSEVDSRNYNDVLKEVSKRLIYTFGCDAEYGAVSLHCMKLLYERFPNVLKLPTFLSWEHYQYLMQLDSYSQIIYYLNLCILEDLSIDELRNKINYGEYYKTSKYRRNKIINNYKIVKFDVIDYLTKKIQRTYN